MLRLTLRIRTFAVGLIIVTQTILISLIFASVLAAHLHWHAPFPTLRLSYPEQAGSTITRVIQTFPAPRVAPGALNWTDEVEPDNWWLQRTKQQSRSEFDWPSCERLMVFGDSMSAPSTAYETWAKSIKGDGRLPPDIMQYEFKLLDALHIMYRKQEYAYDNFAVGGTVLRRSIIPPRVPNWPDFDDEIENYLKRYPLDGGGKLNRKIKPDSTLVILGPFGMNDQKIIARDQETYRNLTSMAELVDAWISGAQRLYDIGHRHFLFLNGPPIEYSPQTTLPNQGGYADRFFISQLNHRMNTLLSLKVAEFDTRNTQGNAMLFDLNGYIRILHQYPELFGYVDTQRFRIRMKGELQKQSLFGLMFADSQGHSSGTSSRQVATAMNGFLLRHSKTFQLNRASLGELEAKG